MTYDYLRPRSLEEAFDLAGNREGARFVAGGTDLLVQMRKGQAPAPPVLISLRNIPELRGVETGGVFRIGSATTVAALIEHRDLMETFPSLARAARWLGSAQLQSTATVGGNLANASPAANLAPPLLVHEARVEIRSKSGAYEVPLETFFTGPCASCLKPGEVLAAVNVAEPAGEGRETFLRKARVRMDLAQVSVAARIETDGKVCTRARLAAGAVAPTPLRLKEVEALLEGRELSSAVIGEAAEAAVRAVAPISDLRASAEYRRTMTGVLVRRAVAALAEGKGE